MGGKSSVSESNKLITQTLANEPIGGLNASTSAGAQLESESVLQFRDARLVVHYPSSEDTNFQNVFNPTLLNQVSRLSLIVTFPLIEPIPSGFVKIIKNTSGENLEVMVEIPDTKVPEEEIKQSLGKCFRGILNRESLLFRWTGDAISTTGKETSSLYTLILHEKNPGGQTIILELNTSEGTGIKVKWSWGDPMHRAKKLFEQFSTRWDEVSNQVITPSWDVLDIDTTGHNLPPLYKHQSAALEAWKKNQFRGIFEMCTGAGKTVAALAGTLLLRQSLSGKEQQLSGVVILCPKKVLVDQWRSELLAKGFSVAAVVCDSPQNYLTQLDTALRGNKPRYIVSTYESFVLPRFQALLRSAAALGLSATPEIENDEVATRQLSEFFGDVLEEARYGLEEALADNVLCPYVYFPVPTFLDPQTSAKYFAILRQTSHKKGKVDLNAYSERRKILRKGEMQIAALQKICTQIGERGHSYDHTLVFCPPGDDYDDHLEDGEETTPLIHKIKQIFQEHAILCTSILAETNDRDVALKEFEQAHVSILLAIGCLDEGMDVPSTRRAIMLYSVDRLRQFVQRRGRVLRKHPGKEVAEIIDLIVLPHNADLMESEANDLLRRELRRYTEFARLARNAAEAQAILEDAIQAAISNKTKKAYI
ncbi:unnamed protein product [Sphagnum balticum]